MRILFCSFGTPGHLFPLVGLALELRRRGHEVAFATEVGACTTLGGVGLERIPRGRTDGDSFALNTWFVPLRVAADVKHVEYAARSYAPDLLVTQQLCQAPLLVAERQEIPVAVMGLFSYLWPVHRPVSPERFASREPTRVWRLEDGARILNEARELFRLPPLAVDRAAARLRGDLFMLRTMPLLEPEWPAFPAPVYAVGPCLWEPPGSHDAWDALRSRFPDPNAPVLYVQQGRTFRSPGFWAPLVEALAGEPVQVVASTGRMDEPVEELPPNFVAEPHVPQGAVMRHARAVVAGGTTTPVLGALVHGLPAVLLPGGGEMVDNVEKVVSTGCAQSLDPKGLTPAALKQAIQQVLEDVDMRRRCREIQRALAPAAGFGMAAERVEHLAATVGTTRSSPAALAVG